MKKLTYIEARRIAEKAFPDSTNLNYKNINPNELVKRVDNILKDTVDGFRYNKLNVIYDYPYLYSEIINKQELIMMNKDDLYQNDIEIKKTIIEMRNNLMKKLENSGITISLSNIDYYSDEVGEISQIKYLTSNHSIFEYISRLLKIDSNSTFSDETCSLIVDDIASHLCLNIDNSQKEELRKIVKDISNNQETKKEKILNLVSIIKEYTKISFFKRKMADKNLENKIGDLNNEENFSRK